MKKLISIVLLTATLLSSTVAFASSSEAIVKLDGTTCALVSESYIDGIEELQEEKIYLEPAIYPEDAEKEKELDQKIEALNKNGSQGVRLDLKASSEKYPKVVLYPAETKKYDGSGSNQGSEKVVHAGVKYTYKGGQDEIKSIILDNGITSAELIALNDFPQLQSIVIPESVKQIFIDGTYKYYTKKDFNADILYRDLGVTSSEFKNHRIKDEKGKISYAINPKYKDAVDDLHRKHNKIENKNGAYEGNINIIFYTKKGSYAEQYLKEIGLNVQNYVTIKYNNKEILTEQPAVIVDGRTLVPLRAIFEAMGASVEWKNNTRTAYASRKSTKVHLQIDSDQLYINDKAKTIDVPAKLINGRTMVPARAVTEAFGCSVKWDAATNTVLITE